MDEPYIYHFPDGNASIARLLVRSLVPAAMPGSTMEDIVLAKARYEELDRPRHRVRIRLNSTVVRVVNGSSGVELGYLGNSDRELHRLRAKHVVMACFNMLIPYVLDGLEDEQTAALRLNVKSPLVYSKVLVRNWRPWIELGVHEIYGVSSHHSRVKLDYPVAMGGYRNPVEPDEPMVLHMVHVPTVPGIDEPRAALRASRRLLLQATFADHEAAIRRDLSRMLGPGGFDDRKDILRDHREPVVAWLRVGSQYPGRRYRRGAWIDAAGPTPGGQRHDRQFRRRLGGVRPCGDRPGASCGQRIEAEMITISEDPNVPKKSIRILVVIAGLVFVAACSGSKAEGGPDLAADVIYAGGDIVTISDAQPTAEALAVKDGRILAVGARSTIEASYKGEDTTIVELGGKTLLPGFLDPHSHYFSSLSVANQVNVFAPPAGPGKDIPTIVAELNTFREQRNVPKGTLIQAYGYDENAMPNGVALTRDDLDRDFPDHPVLVGHVSMHGAVLNSAAMKLYGISADTRPRREASSCASRGPMSPLAW